MLIRIKLSVWLLARCFISPKIAGLSLKCGTAAPHRGVKPANKVGAINYKEPATYKRTIVRSYDRIHGTFYRN